MGSLAAFGDEGLIAAFKKGWSEIRAQSLYVHYERAHAVARADLASARALSRIVMMTGNPTVLEQEAIDRVISMLDDDVQATAKALYTLSQVLAKTQIAQAAVPLGLGWDERVIALSVKGNAMLAKYGIGDQEMGEGSQAE